MSFLRPFRACLALFLLASAPALAAGPGMTAPHWATLKFDEVNGRAGPSFDHPIAWRYRRAGLPVLVIAESGDWRRVRDPDGDEVWVHQRTLSARRSVMARPLAADTASLRRAPFEASRIIARVERNVVLTLGDCEDEWCQVEGAARGWMRARDIWGVRPSDG
ncbi:MAG: hypothetical protein MI723_14010 [Caulobacterales bacterium]|nr:hypothetical protein [Caulobacterales bacterium]